MRDQIPADRRQVKLSQLVESEGYSELEEFQNAPSSNLWRCLPSQNVLTSVTIAEMGTVLSD